MSQVYAGCLRQYHESRKLKNPAYVIHSFHLDLLPIRRKVKINLPQDHVGCSGCSGQYQHDASKLNPLTLYTHPK